MWQRKDAFIFLFGLSLMACGQEGKGVDDNPKEEEVIPVEEGDINLNTSVRFANYEAAKIVTSSCQIKAEALPMIESVKSLTIDGDLGDWTESLVKIQDLQGDANAKGDVDFLMLRFDQMKNLYGGIRGDFGENVEVFLEFGGVSYGEGKTISQVLRLYRFYGGRFWHWQNGWHEVDSASGTAVHEPSIEFMIGSQLFEGVSHWPAWWVRTYTAEGPADRYYEIDSGGSRFFSSSLFGGYQTVRLATCKKWQNQEVDLELHQVVAGDVDPAISELGFQLGYAAIDGVRQFLGINPIAAREFSMVLGAWKELPSHKPLNFHSSHSHLANRYLMLNTVPLSGPSTAGHGLILSLLSLSSQLIDQWVNEQWPTMDPFWRDVFRETLFDQFVESQFGLATWFSLYPRFHRGFFEHYLDAVVEVFDIGLKEDSKAIGFARLLARELRKEELIEAINRCHQKFGKEDESHSCLYKYFSTIERPSVKNNITTMWQGWVEGQKFYPRYAPETLLDPDEDGIPTYWESIFQTSPLRLDTDQDGWSDLAEILLGTNPLLRQEFPDALAADGSFGDWQELIPQRILTDFGHNNVCPNGGDITQYGAILQNSGIMVGAATADEWPLGHNGRWEILIDPPGERPDLIISSAIGSRSVEVSHLDDLKLIKDFAAYALMKSGAFEWIFPESLLSGNIGAEEQDGVKLKMRITLKQGEVDRLCDETDWFSPYTIGNIKI